MNPLFNNLIFGSSINGNILSLLKKALTPVKAPQETIPYNGKPYEKLPLLEPDTKPKTYGPYNLPGVTVEAPNLNKNYRFPYGGINVISKSINGGLDHRQKVVLNPFEGHDLIPRNKKGGELPTAPKAKDRYANSVRVYPNSDRIAHDINFSTGVTHGVMQTGRWPRYIPAEIFRTISNGDTTIVEHPDKDKYTTFPTGTVKRRASNTDKNRKEFDILNRRFEEAWKVAKELQGGSLPTALDAKLRYAGGERITNSGKYFGDSVSVRGVKSKSPWYKKPAIIMERILHSNVDPMFNDTTYAEQPSRIFPVQGVIRAAGNNYYNGKKARWQYPLFGDFFNFNYEKSTPEEQSEYDTLKRRFNTAWNIAK